MKTRLSFTSASIDESLRDVAIIYIRRAAAICSCDYDAERLYDRIVAIHKAREAVRRANRRKRGSR